MNTLRGHRLRVPGLVLCLVAAITGCTKDPDPLDLQAAVDAEVAAIKGGGSYVQPTTEQLATVEQAMMTLCRDGNRAEKLLEPLGYAVTAFKDEAFGGGALHLIREDVEAGVGRRGWGLYVIDCDADTAPVVEVPHPVSDKGTEQLGLDLFAQADAGAFLLAGSKRGPDGAPSDVAHAPASMFSTVHGGLLTRSRQIVQMHGFATVNHEDLPQQAVVSSGSTDLKHGDLSRAVSDALSAAGVSVCLFSAGKTCSGLGATKNVQGKSTRDAGAWFVHVELDEDTRALRKDVAVGAVVDALANQRGR